METIPLSAQTNACHQQVTGTEHRKPVRILQALIQRLLQRHRLNQDLTHLLSLDDRLLKDIGISRQSVKSMLHKSSFAFLDTDLPDCFGGSQSYDFKTIFQSYQSLP